MSNISIGNLNDNYFSIDFAGKDVWRQKAVSANSFVPYSKI